MSNSMLLILGIDRRTNDKCSIDVNISLRKFQLLLMLFGKKLKILSLSL